MTTQAELVFSGGAIYTADATTRRMTRAAAPDGGPAGAVAVAGGRIAAAGPGRGQPRRADRAGHRGGRPARPGAAAGLPGRARPPGIRRRGHGRVQPDRRGHPGPGAGPDRRLRRGPPREGVDLRVGLAAGVVRGRHAGPRRAGRGRRRPARVPAQPGRPRRLGQLGGAAPRPGWTAARRIRRTGGSSARTTARRRAPCTRARPAWSALVPELSLEEQVTGLLLAQRHLHQRGITAWQDAIVGSYLGSPDPLPAYLAAASSGRLTARVRGALWWDRARGAEQLDDLLGPARARPGGPVQRRHREDHAGRRGRELHRGHDRPLPGPGPLPRPRCAACPTSTPRRCGST